MIIEQRLDELRARFHELNQEKEQALLNLKLATRRIKQLELERQAWMKKLAENATEAAQWRRLDALADAKPNRMLSPAMREAQLQVQALRGDDD